MHVCMITSSYPRNASDGAGMYVGSLARGLAARGHTVEVIAPYDPLVEPSDSGGVLVHRFRYVVGDRLSILGHGRSLEADVRLKGAAPFLMPAYMLAAGSLAMRLHRRSRFDIIHGHWAVPGGVIAGLVSKATRRPLVITLHGSDVYLTTKSGFVARAARVGYNQASCVTAVSADLAQRAISAGLNEGRSCVVPSGVASRRFASGDGRRMRAVLGIDANRPVIGALGRLVHKKGFCDLVDAIKLVRLSHPDILCVIGGQGDLAETLRAQARALGLEDRVLLPGAIPWEQAPDFYAMCDAVAVPSVVDRWGNVDGLPLVLLEAMSSGRPVIATAVAGNTDAVVDGVNGLLIPPAAPESLADALNRVLDDTELACELGENARRAAGLRYDWDVIVGEFEAIYSDALSTSSHERSGVSGEARPTGS